MPSITIQSLETINQAAKQLLKDIKNHRILAFYGEMGVGKTTFIKALCKELDVIDTVNSPTFAIVNMYSTAKNTNIYHFDFYRIHKLEEAYDFGYEDYFYSGDICMIEWPELVEPILPETALKVTIKEELDGTRTIYF